MKRFFKQLWVDDRGQSTTEYILILAVVVMIAMKMKQELPKRVLGVLEKVTGDIDKAASSDF
jgi:Flp pilus assembly pilin Flp